LKVEEIRWKETNYELQDPVTNAQTHVRKHSSFKTSRKKVGDNGHLLAEIRERAFGDHIERGGIHGCDLDDWLQAERESRKSTQEQRWKAEEEMTSISNRIVLRSERLFSLTSLRKN